MYAVCLQDLELGIVLALELDLDLGFGQVCLAVDSRVQIRLPFVDMTGAATGGLLGYMFGNRGK